MKKYLILVSIVLLISLGFIIYDNYSYRFIPRLKLEDERIKINKLYVYGTHLGLEGNYDFNDDVELVLYNGNIISYDITYKDGIFKLSDNVNDGLYLDDIPKGDYYLFIRTKYYDGDIEKYKYYGLNNTTEYNNTTYYTMSNYNNKITIDNENSYPTMMMHVKKNIDKNIYDIVIDPGHGGIDGGANKNGYQETDFTLDIATKLKNKLEKYGFKVKLTHEKGQLSDEDKLEEYGVNGRAVISSEVKAKYLFSIHLNSSSSAKVNGLEIYTAKNINYDLSKILANNITNLTGIGYSSNKVNKMFDGIYSRNFTQVEVDESINGYNNNNLIPYDITADSNYYYMIRETGGIITGAYVDDRNNKIKSNPYTKNNIGTEAYLLELGYLSNKNDLDNIINNLDKFVDGIAISIKTLYDSE